MKNIIVFLLLSCNLLAQPNCNVYLYDGDTLQYEACNLSLKFNDYYQFDTKGLAILDSCLMICPHYAYAHYEIAVVYLKAGNFVMWNKYVNDAVKYAPKDYLSSRASTRGKSFADYEGAILDINRLESLVNYDIGHVHDGAYHLDAYRALCYKALGSIDVAIDYFEKHIAKRPNDIGFFDYIHLGVCYLEQSNYKKAIECFKKQEDLNDLAENRFYIALCYKALGENDNYEAALQKAFSLYKVDQRMNDGFQTMEDQIFRRQIKEEISRSKMLKG